MSLNWIVWNVERSINIMEHWTLPETSPAGTYSTGPKLLFNKRKFYWPISLSIWHTGHIKKIRKAFGHIHTQHSHNKLLRFYFWMHDEKTLQVQKWPYHIHLTYSTGHKISLCQTQHVKMTRGFIKKPKDLLEEIHALHISTENAPHLPPC